MNGFAFTSKQHERLLRQLQQTKDARVFRRTWAVLEFEQGAPITRIADALGVSRRSVHRWVAEYHESGDPSALWDERRPGRPRVWTEDCGDLLQRLMESSPEELGFFAVNWTAPLLQQRLEQSTGQRFSDDTIRRGLRNAGYAWKRTRYVLAPDPDREKKSRICRRIADLRSRSVLLVEDETKLLLFPPLRAAWGRRGETTEVRLSGWNASRVVFGTMNLRTGTRLFLVRKRQKKEDFQEFLRALHRHYRGWRVALLLDENPSHTAAVSQQVAEQLKMTLLWLPKRSPELNPMDELWGKAKDKVSANKQRATIDEHADRFLEYLESLSNWETLNASGALSETFWLNSVL